MTELDYISLYPTVATIITGVLAIYVTFQPPESMKAKFIWMIVIAFIALTAIGAIFWQQSIISQNTIAQTQKENKRDNDFSFMKGQLASLIELMHSSSSSPEDTKRAYAALEKLEEDMRSWSIEERKKSSTPDKLPIKKRATLLADQILKFITDRDKSSPQLPQYFNQKDFDDFQKKYTDWVNETMQGYITQFSVRVIAMHDELAENGQNDNRFNLFYNNPVNPIGVRKIGEAIGVMAEKLP